MVLGGLAAGAGDDGGASPGGSGAGDGASGGRGAGSGGGVAPAALAGQIIFFILPLAAGLVRLHAVLAGGGKEGDEAR